MTRYNINGFEVEVSKLNNSYVATAAGINYYFYDEETFDALTDEETPECDEYRLRVAKILADEIAERVYNA